MLRQIAAASLVGLSFIACAAGKSGTEGGGGDASTTSSTTSSSTTTTSSTGGGGTGGATTTGGGGSGGQGGAGGATTTGGGGQGGAGGATTTGGGGAGGQGGTGGGGGAPPTETAIALAAGSASILAADHHPNEAWASAALAGGTTFAPATTLFSVTEGVGLIRSSADGQLLFTKYASGSFSGFLAIGNLAQSMDAPAMTAFGNAAAVAYHKADFKHYFALYNGPMAGWSPVAEPILANNIQSFGPSAPSIAIVNGDVLVAYAGDNGNLYDQRRANGVWDPAMGHGVDGTIQLSPSIIGITAGTKEAMIAYVRKTDTQVMFTVRAAGVWTAPAPVPDAFTNDVVALAPTPSGGAVLAFRGLNTMLYTSVYSPGNGSWSAPQSFGTSVNAPPALARGIGGNDAEMVLVAGGEAKHASLSAGIWSATTTLGATNGAPISIATFSP